MPDSRKFSIMPEQDIRNRQDPLPVIPSLYPRFYLLIVYYDIRPETVVHAELLLFLLELLEPLGDRHLVVLDTQDPARGDHPRIREY